MTNADIEKAQLTKPGPYEATANVNAWVLYNKNI